MNQEVKRHGRKTNTHEHANDRKLSNYNIQQHMETSYEIRDEKTGNWIFGRFLHKHNDTPMNTTRTHAPYRFMAYPPASTKPKCVYG